MMKRIIIHVDMDAFYAAVEVRDNPELVGKPLIIGALPNERGVVATCSYEARKFGVHSAMSIKEAYRLCPHGVFMHPNSRKYSEASKLIHEIWNRYTDLVEYISLDEGFLDVTGTINIFGGAKRIALEIKERTKSEIGLTCSVGIGYSMMSAKLASEEMKPDGFFEIPNQEALEALIIDRNVRIIYGIGPKTAEILQNSNIITVRDILNNKPDVIRLLGNHGKQIIDLAKGLDERIITAFSDYKSKSLGKEYTFQQDSSDFDYLKDVLLLIARDLSLKIRLEGLSIKTVTLKIKYFDMKLITRSRTGEFISGTHEIYEIVENLLSAITKRPIRLVGISLSGFSDSNANSGYNQLTLDSIANANSLKRKENFGTTMLDLQRRFGDKIIKTGNELAAEKRLKSQSSDD